VVYRRRQDYLTCTGRLSLKAPSIFDSGGNLAGWIGVLREVDKSSFEPKTLVDYNRTQSRFEEFVSTLDPYITIWPASQLFVRIFLIFMFFRNKMSGASLPGYVSHLKAGQLDRGLEWLPGPDLRAVNLTMRALQKMSLKKEVCRKAPMTLSKMRTLEGFLDFRNRADVEYASLSRICHDALLRSGEGVKIRFRHLAWSEDRLRLRLSIYGSKCNKMGGVEEVDLVDWGEESAVHYVRTFFDIFDLWSADPAALVFGAYDKPAFVKRVKGLVKLAGLDGDFAGHSFRSGGACDLYAANVPLESIQKMGRWRSNAALLYLRCQEVTPLKIAHAFRLSSEYGFEFWNAGPNVTGMGGKSPIV
jgi:hypothetical protein